MTEQPKIKLMSDEEIIAFVSNKGFMSFPSSFKLIVDECEHRAAEEIKEIAYWFARQGAHWAGSSKTFDDLWQQYLKEQDGGE